MKFVMVCLCLITSASALSADKESVDKLFQQWIKLERNEQSLHQHWQLEQQQLSLRLKIIESEEKLLRETVKVAKIKEDDVAKKRQEFSAKQLKLEQELTQWRQSLPLLKRQFERLWLAIPPYLKSELKLDYLKLHKENNNISDHYRYLTSLIKNINRSDELMHFHRGSIELNGEPLIVDQLFLGNAQGWFVASDNSISGIGFSSKQGWQWKEVELGSEAIRQAIKRYQQQTPGELISLPIIMDATL